VPSAGACDHFQDFFVRVRLDQAQGLKGLAADGYDNRWVKNSNLLADPWCAPFPLLAVDGKLASDLRWETKNRVCDLEELRVQPEVFNHQEASEAPGRVGLAVVSQISLILVECVVPVRSFKDEEDAILSALESPKERLRTHVGERRSAFGCAAIARLLGVNKSCPFAVQFRPSHGSRPSFQCGGWHHTTRRRSCP
jgi:hypothetical protein